jgi:hypothetical protein
MPGMNFRKLDVYRVAARFLLLAAAIARSLPERHATSADQIRRASLDMSCKKSAQVHVQVQAEVQVHERKKAQVSANGLSSPAVRLFAIPLLPALLILRMIATRHEERERGGRPKFPVFMFSGARRTGRMECPCTRASDSRL